MNRSETLEWFLLGYDHEIECNGQGRSTTIGQLLNDAIRKYEKARTEDLLYALHNLQPDHAELTKYVNSGAGTQVVSFERQPSNGRWEDFFTTGHFRLKTLPAGRIRFDQLSEKLEQELKNQHSQRQDTDYSSLSDFHLQDLAINNRIPPKKIVDSSGEREIWDRAHTIEWLRKRDLIYRPPVPGVVNVRSSQMIDDQIKKGQKTIEQIIQRLAEERNVRLEKPVNWHYDFNHMNFWLEVEVEGKAIRWAFSREKVEDSTNDKGIQRDIEQQLGQYVIPTRGEIDGQPSPIESIVPEPDKAREKNYDVFICHATEDKDFVGPLAESLTRAGIRTWYDKFVMKWGDDLRRKIDSGLNDSTFGIVVLSPAFLKQKKWTEYELSGLFAREKAGSQPVILPILHKVSIDDVSQYAPSLSVRLAKNSSTDTVEDIITSLKQMLSGNH